MEAVERRKYQYYRNRGRYKRKRPPTPPARAFEHHFPNNQGQIEESIICYSKLIENIPDNLELLIDRTNLLVAAERYEEAFKDVEKQLEKYPKNLELLHLKMTILVKRFPVRQ